MTFSVWITEYARAVIKVENVRINLRAVPAYGMGSLNDKREKKAIRYCSCLYSRLDKNSF